MARGPFPAVACDAAQLLWLKAPTLSAASTLRLQECSRLVRPPAPPTPSSQSNRPSNQTHMHTDGWQRLLLFAGEKECALDARAYDVLLF